MFILPIAILLLSFRQIMSAMDKELETKIQGKHSDKVQKVVTSDDLFMI